MNNLFLQLQISLHVVTSPENTQHWPYRTAFRVLQYSSRMAVLPAQAEGGVVPGGELLDQLPDNTPPSPSFELACVKIRGSGVSHPPSNDQQINRHPSKTEYFYINRLISQPILLIALQMCPIFFIAN